MALPAIETYTDEKLEALFNAIIVEQERRQRRDNIPGQMAALKAQFLEADGDPALLEDI